jgi:hypothetical protein
MTNSVFVAKFADGEVVRLTTPTGENLNFALGARSAPSAYRSRTKKNPPPIVEAHYECSADSQDLFVIIPIQSSSPSR